MQNKLNKLIVIHWTGGSYKGSLNWMLNPDAKVSAHYLISTEGEIVQLVHEHDKAWHCGQSYLEGFGPNLNNCSIGIELTGKPSQLKLPGWSQSLLISAINLCKDIKLRYPDIRLTDHSTIAPGRKSDVKKGTGVDVFPWDWFVEQCGIEEAYTET